jgi:hypothetical protein
MSNTLQEVEIRRIAVPGQPRQKVFRTLISTKNLLWGGYL